VLIWGWVGGFGCVLWVLRLFFCLLLWVVFGCTTSSWGLWGLLCFGFWLCLGLLAGCAGCHKPFARAKQGASARGSSAYRLCGASAANRKPEQPRQHATRRKNGARSGSGHRRTGWSEYAAKYPSAVEADNTGVWNTPYVIDATNVDNYPLTAPDETT
jgi:hypothetical protein